MAWRGLRGSRSSLCETKVFFTRERVNVKFRTLLQAMNKELFSLKGERISLTISNDGMAFARICDKNWTSLVGGKNHEEWKLATNELIRSSFFTTFAGEDNIWLCIYSDLRY